MCVSLYPAELSATRLMGHVADIGGQTRHVIGYQNTLANRHAGANAMVLPIPAAPGEEIGPHHFLDTAHAPNILRDMAKVTDVGSRSTVRASIHSMAVFNHGAYTIATGRNVTRPALEEALERIPAHRRPELNWDVQGAYPELYPDMPLAFACFNGAEAVESGPLVYHYRPIRPDELMLPALDAHHGRAPVAGEPVATDHAIIVGATGGVPVQYSDTLGDLEPYLPTHVMHLAMRQPLPNGDFTVDVSQLSNPAQTTITVGRTHSDIVFAVENPLAELEVQYGLRAADHTPIPPAP